VKLTGAGMATRPGSTFSILERIDVGETLAAAEVERWGVGTFSILERIDVGETTRLSLAVLHPQPFSILERIDVGETGQHGIPQCRIY